MKEEFRSWIMGESDPMEELLDFSQENDLNREERRKLTVEKLRVLQEDPDEQQKVARVRGRFTRFYYLVAVLSCVFLSCVLLFSISMLPQYGEENPRTTEVKDRYIEKGVEETGAVNVVAGMILDYRAFDTLGESHVLFTALICVMILLRIDRKNQRAGFEAIAHKMEGIDLLLTESRSHGTLPALSLWRGKGTPLAGEDVAAIFTSEPHAEAAAIYEYNLNDIEKAVELCLFLMGR